MILLDYDNNNHCAKIVKKSKIKDYDWNKVRRLVEDNSKISFMENPNELILPWWCLLDIRDDLVNVLSLNDIELDFTPKVKALLMQAKEHESFYFKKTEKYSDEEITDRLQKNGFTRILTQEQLRNVKLILNYPSAATFSVPGAGKTSEALAYYTLKKSKNDKLLVVAPRNAFATWEEEILHCLPDEFISVTRLQGSNKIKEALEKDFDVYLITYQQFYRVVNDISENLELSDFFMFLDESHRIKKGYHGVYGSSILSVCHLPTNKLIMSGTPLPNSIDDLIAQFAFLYPEIPVNSTNVVDKIQPIYVRTTKSELGIKPPIRKIWTFDMKPAQRDLYDSIISETKRRIDRMDLSDRILYNELKKCIVRLIQVTTDPVLLSNTKVFDNNLVKSAIAESPAIKIEEACHLARNLAYSGQKTIIWSQFVNTVENTADLLSDLSAEFIHGGIETCEDEENAESRESIIRRFHDDSDCMVLVANPAACAEGISLHKVCHNAIYIDRNYNAAHYLQSEDRIHRLGLKPNENTHIHIFTCKQSIDQSIDQRLNLKISRMGQVLNDSNLSIEPIEMLDEESGLTFEDLNVFKSLILDVD